VQLNDNDEVVDISAIYVLDDKKIDFGSAAASELIDGAMRKAMKEARRKHKEAGVPMVIERDRKIVFLQPNEIDID
jgi:hypothetical protein